MNELRKVDFVGRKRNQLNLWMTLWHCCQDGGSTPPISTTNQRGIGAVHWKQKD